MLINADFGQRAIVHAASAPWIASPMPGVERRMLDRVGAEVARATSIVRYAAGSAFSAHTHGGGEEFLVLEGVFQDEHGDFPTGTYVRNPPQSAHVPRSDPGCILFVKLHQFDPDDRTHVCLDTRRVTQVAGRRGSDVLLQTLFQDVRETVRIETVAAHAQYEVGGAGGFELLVLDGRFAGLAETFQPLSWLRLPPGERITLSAGPLGGRLWVKELHVDPRRVGASV